MAPAHVSEMVEMVGHGVFSHRDARLSRVEDHDQKGCAINMTQPLWRPAQEGRWGPFFSRIFQTSQHWTCSVSPRRYFTAF